MKARQQQNPLRVQNALKAVANDTYGQCRRCLGPIVIERLEALPDAMPCVNCAEQVQQ